MCVFDCVFLLFIMLFDFTRIALSSCSLCIHMICVRYLLYTYTHTYIYSTLVHIYIYTSYIFHKTYAHTHTHTRTYNHMHIQHTYITHSDTHISLPPTQHTHTHTHTQTPAGRKYQRSLQQRSHTFTWRCGSTTERCCCISY